MTMVAPGSRAGAFALLVSLETTVKIWMTDARMGVHGAASVVSVPAPSMGLSVSFQWNS